MKKTIPLWIASLLGVVFLSSWSPTPITDNITIGGSNNFPAASTSGNIMTGGGNSGKSQYSMIVGANNSISEGVNETARWYTAVFGQSNTVDAQLSFVAGYGNTINSATSNTAVASCAIGAWNLMLGEYGCVFGYQNVIYGNWSTALGTWLRVNTPAVSAVGNYNATTVSGDVFVVGAGVSEATRRNAIRVRDNGDVILGSADSGSVTLAKPQGDISMGIYQ